MDKNRKINVNEIQLEIQQEIRQKIKECNQSRIIIAGTHSGTGKTTITMGLLRVLARKYSVQPFKVGPDYIDPTFHSHIASHKCRNLDSYLLEEEVIKYLFVENSRGKQLSVIEGVMGLFDGAKPDADIGSTAHIAKILKAPVILVVDAKAMSRSVAAIIKGYQTFDEDVEIAGVIFNNVGSDYHYQLLKQATEAYTHVTCLGYLKKNSEIALPSRHLGLVPQSEAVELDKVLDAIADEMEETVDISGVLNICNKSARTGVYYRDIIVPRLKEKAEFKVAIAYDEAFHFYYWDNIDLLRKLGGEVIFFSPLKDEKIPDADMIYIGGGFPEVFAEELSANESMLQHLKQLLEADKPCIAECGGYMYLTKGMTDLTGKVYEMVDFLDGISYMTEKLQRFGYAKLELEQKCLYGERGNHTKVHEFHRSKVEGQSKMSIYQMSKKRGNKLVSWNCGTKKKNTLAGYPHMHWYGNLEFILHFIECL